MSQVKRRHKHKLVSDRRAQAPVKDRIFSMEVVKRQHNRVFTQDRVSLRFKAISSMFISVVFLTM